MEQMTSICDMVGQYMQKKEEDKRIAEDQAAKDRYWKIPICYNDDDDEESSIPLKDIISELPPSWSDNIRQKKEQEEKRIAEEQVAKARYWNIPICNDDDEDDTIAITPDNSLSMGDEHLSTIPEKEESSVEFLVLIPTLKDHSEIFIDSNDDSSNDDDPLYSEEIDYVDASPPDSELVSLEEVKDFEDGEIDIDILLTIKDDILREKLLNINLLIAKIEALKDNPTPSSDFVTKSPSTSPNSFLEETNISYNSLPESETFCFNLEEKSSGNPTSYTDLSLPDYEAFFCDSEPDSGDFTMDVVEDIFDNPTREPRVHVPNVLPTHPTLHLDSDFTLSSDSLGSDLVVSFPSGTRNKIFDPGIFIEVQSKRFLSPNEFSISFIRDPLSPVFDTLLPFSSENEDNIFNPGILASNEEKSPHLLSHRGFKAFQLISDFSESPMMISGGDIPILDVLYTRSNQGSASKDCRRDPRQKKGKEKLGTLLMALTEDHLMLLWLRGWSDASVLACPVGSEDDKTDVLTYHKKLLAKAVKEKEELKTKLENFQSSSKGLSKLLNSQMSAKDKSGLGYGDQVYEGVLSYENEVFQSVFDSRSSDVEDSHMHDRFANVEGMHAVPPPMTGNYMPPKYDFGIDESQFTYGPKQSKTSEFDTQTSNFDYRESNSSVETFESMLEPVVVEPKVFSQPKVWSDAPMIEEYESDSDDEYVIQPSKEQEKPSFTFVNTVKHVKTPRETIKEQNTYSPSPKADKRD
ncbi:hypothetical protein Tco_1004356 [Tanacetum coccineum]|uniref:Uncharacterized protein n=1 Tax=Tanacetum coccineum TaxID=301880 RepID=A0ABQ5FCE8_9ASTR